MPARIEAEIPRCDRCPRLRDYCADVARVKRRAYREEEYWGRPVPGFGDPKAKILIVGLAPAAHGANRTGRMFTGDRSGEWLYGALHRAGLANQAESVRRDDGLELKGAYIGAVCRCAPPGNKPTREEMDRCASWLEAELQALKNLRVVLALGKIAWDALLRRARQIDATTVPRPAPRFGHGAETTLSLLKTLELPVVGSYHPSQQNTQTGTLTRPMFDRVIRRTVELAERLGPKNKTRSR